ncbi:hypothetical protein [Polaromonas sp. CG9_12]|nr:hypothetical protein [Polaromonas sp. CG9_12]
MKRVGPDPLPGCLFSRYWTAATHSTWQQPFFYPGGSISSMIQVVFNRQFEEFG